MEFFSQTYTALRGPNATPQTPEETITKLSDRLSPATLLADRRAAVLALKGLSRDCKKEVGERAIPGLLEVLYNDASIDADIGKAVLETLTILCDAEEHNNTIAPPPPGGVVIGNMELGFKHTDAVLSSDKAVHALFALLADSNFYTRFATLQFLTTLLHNRRQSVQGYFLTAPAGPGSVISVLEDKREIIRNEAIGAVQALTSQSPDIQKVLAFEGAFEKLFNIVTAEGGVDGGVVAQGALTCADALLRFNTSNQSYFRETSLPPVLCALLQFPTKIELHDAAPQEFALQFWDEQKATNTGLILGIMGMLVAKGSNVPENSPFLRCLLETALASNAPTHLKTLALRLLPSNINFPLSEISVTPYLPVPETNGEEWDRLEVVSALDAIVELAIHGEYNGLDASKRTKDGLELRTAAATVFENFVRKEEIKLAIVQSMLPPEGLDASQQPQPTRITPLLHALISPPNNSPHLDPAPVASFQLASLLFAHLLRSSSQSKAAARLIVPGPAHPPSQAQQPSGNFFVPADGPPPPAPEPASHAAVDEDEDENQSLIQILSENLSLSLLSRARADTSDTEAREWDRYVVGYLCLLIQWLWEDPKSVRAFLDAGGLGVLVEPINQVTEQDTLVPGLCTFLLGVCYEFNREPGEITRSTIHTIINRLGPDNLVGQITRLREDERFKSIGPDSIVVPLHPASTLQPGSAKLAQHHHQQQPGAVEEGEIWFDWAFADFWKSNYYTVQRGFAVPPDQLSSSAGQSAESAMLIASLREMINGQSAEIQKLQKELAHAKTLGDQAQALQGEVESLKAKLSASENKCKEVEKEQEDLLVLLDEVTTKRRADKGRMREAGLEVSDDEEGSDDEEEEHLTPKLQLSFPNSHLLLSPSHTTTTPTSHTPSSPPHTASSSGASPNLEPMDTYTTTPATIEVISPVPIHHPARRKAAIESLMYEADAAGPSESSLSTPVTPSSSSINPLPPTPSSTLSNQLPSSHKEPSLSTTGPALPVVTNNIFLQAYYQKHKGQISEKEWEDLKVKFGATERLGHKLPTAPSDSQQPCQLIIRSISPATLLALAEPYLMPTPVDWGNYAYQSQSHWHSTHCGNSSGVPMGGFGMVDHHQYYSTPSYGYQPPSASSTSSSTSSYSAPSSYPSSASGSFMYPTSLPPAASHYSYASAAPTAVSSFDHNPYHDFHAGDAYYSSAVSMATNSRNLWGY